MRCARSRGSLGCFLGAGDPTFPETLHATLAVHGVPPVQPSFWARWLRVVFDDGPDSPWYYDQRPIDDRPSGLDDSIMSGAEVAGVHERLTLGVLAIDGGDRAEVMQAMRGIMASAPVGKDVALVLSLSRAQAGDQALRAERLKTVNPRVAT